MNNKKTIFRSYVAIAALLIGTLGFAKEDVPSAKRSGSQTNRDAMKFGNDCAPASQSADLDINNVRTKILNGGDMWWDLSSARYEVPKIDDLNSVRKHSMFAGAIWLGGEDDGNNLKLAAMTYRQRGSDFWPGPLDPLTSNTDAATCQQWDKIFKVDGADIIAHAEEAEANGGSVALPALSIREWPGANDANVPRAPFYEDNGNGVYEPELGEYPILGADGCDVTAAEDQPDQMLWWLYNDKGNIHSESQGNPIGVEMQTTAFAFATNDQINDMTFYTTRITNRGFSNLSNTYFGQWVDADLGNYVDDYVGCDVSLSLGFCYNGDDNDEGVLGYGLNPPSVGVDFFEGPKLDSFDINGNQIELGLSKFVYYNNNTNQINGNPDIAPDFYNYLQGKWMNGADIQYGGDGIINTDGTVANYMFPFDTDPDHSEFWSEGDWRGNRNQPADRRFIQSSGPFVLKPGAVQRLTVGVVWAKASFGGAEGSLNLLKEASKKAQELFNSCFDLIDGPDAPEMEVQELDQQLVISLGNTNSDKVEKYKDTLLDGKLVLQPYSFQGYRLFQLKDGSVSNAELSDISKAREVFQCDLEDDFDVLVNQEFDADVNQAVPVLKIRGNNEGLAHTISVTEDQFALGSNKSLVNFKTYYYILLSYAVGTETSNDNPYLEGRKVQKFSASPHKSEPRFSGSNLQAAYGEGPELVRIAGRGNGGNNLDFTPETEEEIVRTNFMANPKYARSRGPVKVTIIDPLKVPKGDFELTMIEELPISRGRDGVDAAETRWELKKVPENIIITADTTIDYKNEQVILESTTGDKISDWGLAITIEQVEQPGISQGTTNGLVDWEVIWEDPSNQWLTAMRDRDVTTAQNFGMFDWIRSGSQVNRPPATYDESWHDYTYRGDPLDPNGAYEGIWEGRVAPFRLTSKDVAGGDRAEQFNQALGYTYQAYAALGLENLASVDLVITRDQSKWSECVMLESCQDASLNPTGTRKFDMRTGTLTWDGGTLAPGKTMFPGYAINLETGERLNIIVTEDSYQIGENGNDMKWNPTDNAGFKNNLYPSNGGRHYVYVMGSHQGITAGLHPKLNTYDNGNQYHSLLSAATTDDAKDDVLGDIFQNCLWVAPTYLAPGFDMDEEIAGIPAPPSDFRLRLRVSKPYAYFDRTTENDGIPKYTFNTDNVYNEISTENGKDAMELINIVPNPYYAFSGYESSTIENKVKITNLPEKCEISIYTLDGALVRRINKDDESTEASWNLQNNASVPIASGLYIIHVDAGELGEKVLKWMGVMRQLDLDSF